VIGVARDSATPAAALNVPVAAGALAAAVALSICAQLAVRVREPGAEAGTLYVRRVSLAVLWRREHGVRRIFVVEVVPPWISPARYLAPGCRLAWQVQPAGMTARVWLYTR
jgi:hypothetical protein